MGKAIFMAREGILYPKVKNYADFSSYAVHSYVSKVFGELANLGFMIVIIGYSKHDEPGASYRTAYDRVSEVLRNSSFGMIRILTCYHSTEEKCNCRIPKSGLINDTIKDFSLDLKESFMVVSSVNELKAARTAKIGNIVLIKKLKEWSKTAVKKAVGEISDISFLPDLLKQHLEN